MPSSQEQQAHDDVERLLHPIRTLLTEYMQRAKQAEEEKAVLLQRLSLYESKREQ